MNNEHAQDTFTESFIDSLRKDFPMEYHNIDNLADIAIFIEKHFPLLETMNTKEEIKNHAITCYLQEKSEIIRYFIDNGILSFSPIAIERINKFMADNNIIVKEEDFSEAFIDFPSIQDALNYFGIDNGNMLEYYGSWEELSNNHILFMF